MKKLTIIIIGLIFSFSVMAQEKEFEYKTLFSGDGITSHGGYGSYSVAYSQIGGFDALLTGGSGLWLIDHVFGLGFGGYGAFPVVLSAIFLRYPTLIHEQNAVPGRANAILAKFVQKIAISLFHTFI